MASSRTCCIWLNPEAGLCVLLDEEDYEWALQWRWFATPNSTGNKYYATRNTRQRKIRKWKQIKIYMHKAILIERMQEPKPSKRHKIGDHMNGDSLDCRRENLRWATPKMNAQNRRKPEPAPVMEQEIPF